MRTVFRTFMWLSVPLLLAQCSVPYQVRYQKVSRHQTAEPNDLAGAWEGTWHSEKSGHHGKLKAIVTPRAGSSEIFDFHYHATWAACISGRFKTFHHAKATGGANVYRIEGKHDLPWFYGGTYTYEGQATTRHFQARYTCQYDHGEFVLKRPEQR